MFNLIETPQKEKSKNIKIKDKGPSRRVQNKYHLSKGGKEGNIDKEKVHYITV